METDKTCPRRPKIPNGFGYFAIACLLCLGSLGGCMVSFAAEPTNWPAVIFWTLIFMTGIILDGISMLLDAIRALRDDLCNR